MSNVVIGSNQEVSQAILKGPFLVILTKVDIWFNMLLDYAGILKLLPISILKNLVYISQYFRLLKNCPVQNTKQNINCNVTYFCPDSQSIYWEENDLNG